MAYGEMSYTCILLSKIQIKLECRSGNEPKFFVLYDRVVKFVYELVPKIPPVDLVNYWTTLLSKYSTYAFR